MKKWESRSHRFPFISIAFYFWWFSAKGLLRHENSSCYFTSTSDLSTKETKTELNLMSDINFLTKRPAKRLNPHLIRAFIIRLTVRTFLNSFLRAPSDSLMYAEVAIAPPRVLSAGYPGPIPSLRGVMNLPLKNFPSSTACGCNQSLFSTSACQNSLFFSPFFCHRQQLQKHERYARLSSKLY